MEFESSKWYIYKKYGVDTYVPMLWGENILQFDTREAAEDFMAVAHRELGFKLDKIAYDNVAWFNSDYPIFDATFFRFKSRIDGHDFLYDIRKENQ